MENGIDCGFTTQRGWFRYRACGIIIKDGMILVAKNDGESYYYSVGGGVRLHECAEDAVKREVFEETGEHYEIDRLYVIHENFFVGSMTSEEQNCHEIALYFLMKPKDTGTFKEFSITSSGAKERVVWLPIDKLHEYEVYPAFYKECLLNLHSGIKHIVTRNVNF